MDTFRTPRGTPLWNTPLVTFLLAGRVEGFFMFIGLTEQARLQRGASPQRKRRLMRRSCFTGLPCGRLLPIVLVSSKKTSDQRERPIPGVRQHQPAGGPAAHTTNLTLAGVVIRVTALGTCFGVDFHIRFPLQP